MTKQLQYTTENPTNDNFWNMDLSSFSPKVVTNSDLLAIFGQGTSIQSVVDNGYLHIVADPFGGSGNVFRLEFPDDYIGQHLVIPMPITSLSGWPGGSNYEVTETLEVGLATTWDRGMTSIHMPNTHSSGWPGSADVPAKWRFGTQYTGYNSFLQQQWQAEGKSPWPDGSKDFASSVYVFDQSLNGSRVGFCRTTNPVGTVGTSVLPDSSQTQFKRGAYTIIANHVKVNTESGGVGQGDGFYKQYQDGILAFNRTGINLFGDGRREPWQRYSFNFYVGGDRSDPSWRVPPGGGPHYMYIRNLGLKIGAPA